MLETLTRNWRLVALRGVSAIIFGLSALLWQSVTVFTLTVFFGIYALLDGVLMVGMSLAHAPNTNYWKVFLLEGLITIAAGVIALTWPFAQVLANVLLIGAWAILTGILQVAASIPLRREIKQERLMVFGGLVSVTLGALLFGWPHAGIVTVVWTISVNIQIFGMLMIALGLLLKRQQMQAAHQTHPA